MRLGRAACPLLLACALAQAELGWIAVDTNPEPFPAVSQAAYDPECHAFAFEGALRYRPSVNRDKLIEIFTAMAASPAVQTRLSDRFAREGALDPDSHAMQALRSAAWDIRGQASLSQQDRYSLHFIPPRFEICGDEMLPLGSGLEIGRIWGRLPVALSNVSPQIDTGRGVVETIAFARGLKSRGIPLAPLVAAMEGPAAPKTIGRVLVLGFEPYGGRSVNASAAAARALAGEPGVAAVRILPVEWERAAQEALAQVDALEPDFVLAFGEHAVDWFHIETLVYNRRWTTLADNAGQKAPTSAFVLQGPAAYDWPGRPYSLAAALAEKGYPSRISRDPGREQCAGVLYALAQRQFEKGEFRFAFVHVPRIGQPLAEGSNAAKCTRTKVQTFARECLQTVGSAGGGTRSGS